MSDVTRVIEVIENCRYRGRAKSRGVALSDAVDAMSMMKSVMERYGDNMKDMMLL